MPGYPGTSDALQTVFMDADGPHSLTAIAIPAGQSIPLLTAGQPSTWQNIAKGGYPINPPGALALGTPNGYTTFGAMTPSQQYQYTLTNVTDYGETLESAILTVTAVQMGSNTSLRLNLPPDAQSTIDVKVRARRLYRSAGGGTTRGFVAQINDMNLTHYIDGLSDIALGDAPPTSDTSGSTGAVTVVSTDGAYASWIELPYGSSLVAGTFSVDYGFDANGGTVHFAAADVGKHITITFIASIALTSAFFSSQIQAIKDIRSVLGSAPQGFSTDLSARLTLYESGMRQLGAYASTQAANYGSQFQAASNIFTDWGPLILSLSNSVRGAGMSISGAFTHGTPGLSGYGIGFTCEGGTVILRLHGRLNCQDPNPDWLKIGASVDGGSVVILHTNGDTGDTLPATPGTTAVSGGGYVNFDGLWVINGLSIGFHTIYPVYQCGGAGPSNAFRIAAAGDYNTGLWLTIEETF